MAGAASAHQAATASHQETSQQRAGRRRRTSADPQRAQQVETAATTAAPAALDSLSRLQQLADASPRVAQLRRLQALADGRFAPVAQLAGGPEEEELIQGKFAIAALQPQLQQVLRANNTGLPDQLKSGIESLSGLSMDHVRVHYNSSQPAQLNALAYAQGSEIHVAPGQERHLPHEAWHVVQQAQGRVRPTLKMKDGVQVNDDVGLEREADVMGSKALEGGHRVVEAHRSVSMPIETAQPIDGDATNSLELSVANNDSAPLATGRGSAQRGGNEMQRIADQRPEAALQRQEIHTAFGPVATPAQMPPTATGMPDPLKADTESLSPQGRVRATTQMEENASAFSGPADRLPIQRVRFLSVKRIAQQGSLYEGIGGAGPPALAHNGGLTWWGPHATALTYAAGGGSMWRSTAANALNLVDMSAPEKLGKTMRETIRRSNNNLSPALQRVLRNHDFAYAVPHAVAQTAQMCLDYANAQFTNHNGHWRANDYVTQAVVDNALQSVNAANEIPLWVGSVIQTFADHGSPNALMLDDANFLASPDNYVVLRKDATNLDAGFADALLADLNEPNMAGEFHGLHVPAGMKFGGFTDTKHEILIRNSPANLTQPVAPQGGDPDLQVSDKTLGVDDSLLARAWRWFGLNN
jgi:hypothetical protein